ncbi:hypothetical protein POX_c04547 [Penicillium oxalicum]|nr:hypothetical protein POX_c04547 [Penicillium oxalicum]KAI2791679.1 hypothetical protein POX_c04547 [Penicillium oxalicum]
MRAIRTVFIRLNVERRTIISKRKKTASLRS